jgi:hypothetical protein
MVTGRFAQVRAKAVPGSDLAVFKATMNTLTGATRVRGGQ